MEFYLFISFNFYSVLSPKLLNNPSAFCSFKNLDFLIPYTAHFDCIIILKVS